jgi:hypothetical protein
MSKYIPVPRKYCPIRKKNTMIWHAALSTFVLNKACELVTKEKTRVPLFRNRDLKAIVEPILKYIDREVCVAQVYNHPRLESKVGSCMHAEEDGGAASGGEDISYDDGR